MRVVGDGFDLRGLLRERRLLGTDLLFDDVSFRLINRDLLQHHFGIRRFLLEDGRELLELAP